MKNSTKKLLLVVAVFSFAFSQAPSASAQSARFTYSNFSGTFTPGSSFTFDITLNFTTGGGITNINGFSYWLYQVSPASAPYFFSVTQYNSAGSLFQSPAPTLPQALNPITPTGFGGMAVNPLPTGNYFVARVTLSIAGNATLGNYTFGNTTSTTPNVGGRISVGNDSNGNTFPIAASNFNVAVVPEPATVSLVVAGAVFTGIATARRRNRRR